MVDITDAFCSNTANGTVIVTVNPLPSATISGGATLCADGSTAPIDITANGTAPFNVIYSDGFNNVTLNGISSPYNFQTNITGVYTLNSITDATGCSGTVAKWCSEGMKVVYVLCTDGSKGSEDKSITSSELVKIRQDEQIVAGKILGLSLIHS